MCARTVEVDPARKAVVAAENNAGDIPHEPDDEQAVEQRNGYRAVEPRFDDKIQRIEENAGTYPDERPFVLSDDDPNYDPRAVWMVNDVLRQSWGGKLQVADQDRTYYAGRRNIPPRRNPEEGLPQAPTVFKLPDAFAVYTLLCGREISNPGTIEERADELGIETTPRFAENVRAAVDFPIYVGYTRNPYWDIGVQLDAENPNADKLPRLRPPLECLDISWYRTKAAAERARDQTAKKYYDKGLFVRPYDINWR